MNGLDDKKENFSLNLILYLIALTIMGSNGVVVSFIKLTSIEVVLMRTIIGSMVMIIVCILHKEKFLCLRDKYDVINLIGSGLTLGAGWLFLFEAYRQVGVGISTLLYYCGPMIAMLLSPIFFKERLTWSKILGAVVVFVGIILLNGKLAGDPSKIFGLFCGAMSAILYAVMVIFNKKVKNATGIENTTCQLVVSFFLVFMFMMFTGGIHIKIEGIGWIPVLWMGVINTGLSCFLYYSTIPRLPLSTVAICSYMDPVSAVIMASLFLGETLTIIQIIGVVLVLGGAAFSQLYKSI